MLILPIALISWSILIFFLNTIIGIICGLFCPILRTFDSECDLILWGLNIFLMVGISIIIVILIIYYKLEIKKLPNPQSPIPFDLNKVILFLFILF